MSDDFLPELIGDSPGIVAIREKLARLLQRGLDARRLPPILIQGETGTGKGLLARAIHRASARRAGPFVDVNCAAIPETLVEAELFGHERGAFTDARQPRRGLLQEAHGGTVFLDEVGLLPLGVQGKLLIVVEERMVRRLGSTKSEPVDMSIITATNEDLPAAVRARRFREDLYHRIAVITLWLPPLRERGSDTLILAERFLARVCADWHLPAKTFTADARAALLAHTWPGNIRELSNVIERVALEVEDERVTADMLALRELGASAPGKARGAVVPLRRELGVLEREHLLAALEETDWNLSRAAELLGMPRNTVRYRMAKHGLRRAGGPPDVAPATPAMPHEATHRASVIRWERRRLTLLRVIFDLASLAESPPHASRALELLAQKVRTFGGRIEEMAPSGAVAVFGLEPVEDAPRRAAHAAMAIQKAAERARRDDSTTWTVRLAIHVGQFLVGESRDVVEIDLDGKRQAWSEMDGLLAGAEANTIVVSAPTARLLRRRFDFARSGTEAGLYRLEGRERTGYGFRRGMPVFVGRGRELEALQNQLALTTRGACTIVGLVGEAGIGKSRLLYEFRQSLRGKPIIYREGRCVSHGSTAPYLPIIDLIRQACRITEADGPESIVDKVAATLRQLRLDPSESAPYLLHLLGVTSDDPTLASLSPEAIKTRTFETLRRMSLHASRHRPLIYVVEDLHWIDKTSEECIAALVESLAGAPILFVSTYRPGYQPPWLNTSYSTQLALRPLSPEDSRSVVHSVLHEPDVPESLVRLILSKAEGNPFFLEELSRTVRETGDLRPGTRVPDTVQDVLLARLDRLPAEPRALLQTASVLGREISMRLLGAVWDGRPDVEPLLRHLMRYEFLYEPARAAEPALVFKHTLTQEVVYESLSAARRKSLHARAGHALELLYSGRLEEVHDRLAYHYSRAEEAPRAVEYLTRVAARAARGHAHTEAVSALKEALTHVDGLPAAERDRRRLALTLREASSLIPLGRFHEARDLLLRLSDLVDGLDDPAESGHYHLLLGRTYSFLAAPEQAAASARRAIAEAARCGDEATMGKAYCVLAVDGPFTGRAVEAMEYALEAVRLLERTDDRWWLGQAHWAVALNHGQIGDFDAALEAAERTRAIGEALGDARLQSFAAWLIGSLQAARGECELGIVWCQKAVDCSPDPLNTAITEGWLGFAYLEQGDAERAVPVLDRAVRQLGQFAYRHFHGWFIAFLAEAHRLTGKIDDARTLAYQAAAINRDTRLLVGIGWAEQVLGRIALGERDLERAQRHFAEALTAYSAAQSRYEIARTRLDIAALARARGDRAAASSELDDAMGFFREHGITHWAERAAALARELGSTD